MCCSFGLESIACSSFLAFPFSEPPLAIQASLRSKQMSSATPAVLLGMNFPSVSLCAVPASPPPLTCLVLHVTRSFRVGDAFEADRVGP
ncbi:hypothetical protein ACRRTK_001693 [Alexandromys fortis]